MRFIISTLILLIVAVPAAVFAVSNESTVVLRIWPLPFEVEIYVYLLVFIPLLAGLFIGYGYAVLMGGKTRRRARENAREATGHKRRIAELETELENLKGGDKEAEANLPATVETPGGRAAA